MSQICQLHRSYKNRPITAANKKEKQEENHEKKKHRKVKQLKLTNQKNKTQAR
jgi:hypothetical protein